MGDISPKAKASSLNDLLGVSTASQDQFPRDRAIFSESITKAFLFGNLLRTLIGFSCRMEEALSISRPYMGRKQP